MNRIRNWLFVIICMSAPAISFSQNSTALTIENIMQGKDWIGHWPGNLRWSHDSKTLYFDWNPGNLAADSLYQFKIEGQAPTKVLPDVRRALSSFARKTNRRGDMQVYEKNGDLFLLETASGSIRQLTNSIQKETNPAFLSNDKSIGFQLNNNLYSWDLQNGQLVQLTNFKKGKANNGPKPKLSGADQWLKQDQLNHFQVLKERKEKQDATEKAREKNKAKRPKAIYYGNKSIGNIRLAPNERYVTFRLRWNPAAPKPTKVPNYVTEGGYTEEINARAKVGNGQSYYKLGIYDLKKDSCYYLDLKNIPGINDTIDFLKDNKQKDGQSKERQRKVITHGPIWSENGDDAIIVVRSQDNKDRWIMSLDLSNGQPSILDRQHDGAWIGGPGISGWNFSEGSIGWMPDNESVWFQSEAGGYSHLWVVNVRSGKKKRLTKGKFEIYNPKISKDKKHFYFSSNEVHPGERHFYKMDIKGGKPVKLTTMPGRNDVVLSPDEKTMAILHSYANQPWELYMAENKEGSIAKRITYSQSDSFKAYQWREPEFVTFKAGDGAKVQARLYRPEQPQEAGAAVIFVHGAGYLQNAHKWWSTYFREYMFHNLLADHGYTVLDIDYRGSAGYGRDWRTGIYRFMGGKDLDDQVDGARFLVEEYGVDPEKIGIYGGSYGGFITLMAMFTKPGVFKAGAALRSVTDWAHYNHPYTSNILNTPELDSLAYIKSSPIYHAEGLQDALLICHGMVDTNVHFQDVVRLSQRLIELGKENWELAVYPVENHGFQEPSSWTDEYKRIFRLFEANLK